jgi:putative toxin-antitoxin system antitoxin component (TIGR02293 family)
VVVTAGSVASKLGGKKVLGRELRSESDLIRAVREGLPALALEQVFQEFADVGGVQSYIYEAVGNTRTLQRKRAQRRPLSADESDRLARLARILVRAEEALGERGRAHRWLTQPNRALDGRRPIELLDSDAGTLLVERLLGRIEHGIYS